MSNHFLNITTVKFLIVGVASIGGFPVRKLLSKKLNFLGAASIGDTATIRNFTVCLNQLSESIQMLSQLIKKGEREKLLIKD